MATESTWRPGRWRGDPAARLAVGVMLIALGGCASSSPPVGGRTSPATNTMSGASRPGEAAGLRVALLDAVAALDAGRPAEAARMAEEVRGRATGVLRDEAAYVAGLARFAGGSLGDADRLLSAARRSPDRAVASRADAALGLVHVVRGRDRDALRAFDRSWPDLDRAERPRLARAAERAATRANDRPAAIRWRERAIDADRAARADAIAAGGGDWTVQVGAFDSQSRARSAADRAGAVAQAAGLGPVNVRRSSASGRELWFVQFGAFASRGQADAAIRRNGWSTWIAAAVRG